MQSSPVFHNQDFHLWLSLFILGFLLKIILALFLFSWISCSILQHYFFNKEYQFVFLDQVFDLKICVKPIPVAFLNYSSIIHQSNINIVICTLGKIFGLTFG